MPKQVGVQTTSGAGGVTGHVGAPTVASASGPASAIVSGAGTAAANGTYTPRGTSDGKPYYNLIGQPDSTVNSCIVSMFSIYELHGAAGAVLYAGDAETDFPWQAGWMTVDGDDPAPTVTQG